MRNKAEVNLHLWSGSSLRALDFAVLSCWGRGVYGWGQVWNARVTMAGVGCGEFMECTGLLLSFPHCWCGAYPPQYC